jgi:peptidyl-prolyl cis-trans isomerase B (cyclophilin B)
VPSEKRIRQRERRNEKVAVEQLRSRRNRRIRTAVGAVVVAGIVVGFIALLSGSSKPKKAATPTTTTIATVTSATKPTCPPTGGTKKRYVEFTAAPPVCIATTGVYDAKFVTDAGSFTVELPAASSLAGVNDFVFLARHLFYSGTIFHRVIPGFVVQGGSPNGTGSGSPGYSFTGNTPPKSCTAKKDCYATGDVALANSGSPSSDGSQFFIILPGGADQLQPLYTTIGKVTSGMSVVEAIGADGSTSGTPKVTHHLKSVTITEVSA